MMKKIAKRKKSLKEIKTESDQLGNDIFESGLTAKEYFLQQGCEIIPCERPVDPKDVKKIKVHD